MMNATAVNSIILQDAMNEMIARCGGVRAAARVLKVSAPYVSRIARGEKIWPDDKLLRKLGVGRSVIYMRTTDSW